ncbi:MAG: NrfD/PsrC family molybdoenzyme membrane anchor subunit, partial [Myxococcaceae bacterium]
IGSLIPFILLFIVVVMNRFLHERVRNALTMAASLLLLVQVFSMRWNIVIGGQLLSKSFRGLRSGYTPHLFDKEGVGVALAMFIVPFVLLFIFNRVLPIYSAEADAEHPDSATPVSDQPAPVGGHS